MSKKPEEQKEEHKLLDYFIQCMRAETFNPLEKHTFISINVPLEVIVVSTDPKLIVTDQKHKVQCEVSKEALLKMKQRYPNYKLKDLNRKTLFLNRFAPHTNLDGHRNLLLTLHIYEFDITENEKDRKIAKNIKDLATDEEILSRFWFIEYKDLRRFINAETDPEKLPSLEKVALREGTAKPIECILKFKPNKKYGDELGKPIIEYDKLDDDEEDKIREEANHNLLKEKEEKKREKEIARQHAKELKQKPRNLSKQLTEYAVSEALKKAKSEDGTIMKENVADFIQKSLKMYNESDKRKSVSKNSVRKSTVSKKDLVPKQANPSEMKFKLKGFREFVSWREKTGALPKDATDVSDVLKNSKTGGMQIGFIAPEKPARKAFEGMVSTMTPEKKRIRSEGTISASKSVTKRFKP